MGRGGRRITLTQIGPPPLAITGPLNLYDDVWAKPLVLSKNGILIKYAYKCIKIREGVCIHGELVFVKYCPQVKFNT